MEALYPPAEAWPTRSKATVGTPGEPWGVTVDVWDATPTPPSPSGDDYRAAVAVHKDVSRLLERMNRYEDAARHRDRMHACKDRAINACCSLCDPRCESWHTSHEAATGWLYEHRLTVHGTEP
jgi:hypothetical protein